MQPRAGGIGQLRGGNELRALEAANRPAFLWSADGSALLWANMAAARFLGFNDVDELFGLSFTGTALAAQLGMVRRALKPGTPRMELLRMPAKDRILSFIARISSLETEGEAGLLVIGPETKPATMIVPPLPKPFGAFQGMHNEPPPAKPYKPKKSKKLKKQEAEEPKKQRREYEVAAAEKSKKKKKKDKNAADPVVKIALQKARIDGQLEPHEHESFRTIARVLSGEEEINLPVSDVPQDASSTSPLQEMAAPQAQQEDPASIDASQQEALQDDLRSDLRKTLQGAEKLAEQNRMLQNELHDARVMTAELQTILDTATDGIFILDGEGHILNMNQPAEALFGLGLDALEGENIIDLLAPEAQERALIYIQKFALKSSARVMNSGCEVTGIEKNGGRIPLFMTLGSLGGQIPGSMFCAVLRDITQWKQAEAELIAAKKRAETASDQKTDFLAKISHEIRTPLNAIIGFSEVMLEERFGSIGNERYKQYLNDIHTSGGHLLSLVNDLLDLSKIEAGKLDLVFSAVQLNDIVLQTISLLQPQANRRGIIIRSSLQPVMPVAADPRSIHQVLLNLLSNAIRFTPEGGQIIISTLHESDGGIVLRVRDTGIGMAENDIALALEPFRQIRTESAEGKQDGTGLGLPISKALVEANHALFDIKSEPKKGTLVSVTFPKDRVLDEAF